MQHLSRYIGFYLLGVLLVSCGLSAEQLRIATYNVRNYLVMDRYVGASWRPSYPKPEIEKAAVREVIRAAEPDILVLQEMGTIGFLEELRTDLKREGLYYPYMVHMVGNDPDRHLAILAKIEPLEVQKHSYIDFNYLDRRERVKRGLLEATFAGFDGQPFVVFTLHLKSRYTEDKEDPNSENRRAREAQACRDVVLERTIERGFRRFMIVGDFNAPPGSAPLRRFYRKGDLEFGTSLLASDTRGEVWTYFYEKGSNYQAVDGFVLSDSMFNFVKNEAGSIVDIESAPIGSDHRMVYADFVFEDGAVGAFAE